MKNNFDFLRLVFALLVIVTHSFILSGVDPSNEWLLHSTGFIKMAEIGVYGFFCISGYLIYQSLCRSKSLVDYFKKRILRIYPALIVVILLTVILCSFIASGAYWSNSGTWSYIPANLSLYKLQFSIPGVFENNPYKGIINGSLWTIAYEVTFYIALAVLFFLSMNEKRSVVMITVFVLGICRIFFFQYLKKYGYVLQAEYIMDYGLCFSMGALLASLRVSDLMASTINFIHYAALFLMVLFVFINSRSAFLLVFPVVVILTGIRSTPGINKIHYLLGDLSYGVYIYGFPVQQALVYFFHLSYWQLMITAIPVTMCFAWLSWHLIEKKALQLKTKPNEQPEGKNYSIL